MHSEKHAKFYFALTGSSYSSNKSERETLSAAKSNGIDRIPNAII